METIHRLIFGPAQDMSSLKDESIGLVVTSPPYPMIEMWDQSFKVQNPDIDGALATEDYLGAYQMMHDELDRVWAECVRVLQPGGHLCINIGDATRNFDHNFRLFSNHARIITSIEALGIQSLPYIIWRKQTNAPNKFMGSGMIPPGAYITLEHEYILIFRKGRKRAFQSNMGKFNRKKSAYFWHERNEWFSDLWAIKGTRQSMTDKASRTRSAAYPFEIPFRLINMFSVIGDQVLDPFVGTGTTMLAAVATGRSSQGIDIDDRLAPVIEKYILDHMALVRDRQLDRLTQHKAFVSDRRKSKGASAFKHHNQVYNTPVMTRQETHLELPIVDQVIIQSQGFRATYLDHNNR